MNQAYETQPTHLSEACAHFIADKTEDLVDFSNVLKVSKLKGFCVFWFCFYLLR